MQVLHQTKAMLQENELQGNAVGKEAQLDWKRIETGPNFYTDASWKNNYSIIIFNCRNTNSRQSSYKL
jgi:hypothetical protein